jgi:hypothetical protein
MKEMALVSNLLHVGNGGICLVINYSVLNETKKYEE